MTQSQVLQPHTSPTARTYLKCTGGASSHCGLVAIVSVFLLQWQRVESDDHCVTGKFDDIAAMVLDNIDHLYMSKRVDAALLNWTRIAAIISASGDPRCPALFPEYRNSLHQSLLKSTIHLTAWLQHPAGSRVSKLAYPI